jgi:hypothetical protein
VLITSPVFSFESDAFPVAEGEDAATNPGIYGKALAEWVAAKLNERGLSAKAPYAEDWGWCVEVSGHPNPTGVACAGEAEEGAKPTWRVYAFVDLGLLARFRGGKEAAQGTVDQLSGNLKEILSTTRSISKLLIDEESP